MVSEIPYPHLTRALRAKRRMSFHTLVPVLMVGLLIWALSRDDLVALLFVMGWCYILYNPIAALVRLLKGSGGTESAEPRTADGAKR